MALVGISLAVALLSSVGTFMVTLQNTLINQRIEQTGYFHAMVDGISGEEYEKLNSNIKIENIELFKQEQPQSLVKDKTVLITEGNQDLFQLMNVILIDGRFPIQSNELVLEEWVLKYFEPELKIGQTLDLMIEGEGLKTFNLVGIVKDKLDSKFIGMANAYVYQNIKSSHQLSALIKISDDANKREVLDTITTMLGTEKVRENIALLQVTGETANAAFNGGLLGLIITIVIIIVGSSIVFIYNTFHIRIIDRTKQFGQLRAMGATKKQIKKMVLKEATLMSLIAIPIGLILGVLAVYIASFIFVMLSKEFSLQVIISSPILIISAVVGWFTVYFSAVFPAKSASKISPLMAIHATQFITQERSHVKKVKFKWLTHGLKIDKIMAIRNIKRNKKQFRISVLSMAISVILIISFLSFMKMTQALGQTFEIEDTMQFEVAINQEGNEDESISLDFINQIKRLNGVEGVYLKYSNIQSSLITDNKNITTEAQGRVEKVNFKSKEQSRLDIMLNVLDQNKLELIEPYVSSGIIDELAEDEVIIVKRDTAPIQSPVHLSLNVGDLLNLIPSSFAGQTEYQEKEVITYKVKAIINDLPSNLGLSGLPNLMLSPEGMKKMTENTEEKLRIQSIDVKVNELENIDSIENQLIHLMQEYPEYQLYNKSDLLKQDAIEQLRIAILIIGFVMVIILISGLNVMNTIFSNIMVRKREIASLKAIGMTTKEIKSMICLEGVLFGIYGGIIGSLFGILISYVMHQFFSMLIDESYRIPWATIFMAMILVVFIGYESALISFKKIETENMIEYIK